MSIYNRQSGRQSDQKTDLRNVADGGAPLSTEKTIKVDGFGQVLAMLEIADDDFRDSLLKRIAQRDPALAQQLFQEISKRR